MIKSLVTAICTLFHESVWLTICTNLLYYILNSVFNSSLTSVVHEVQETTLLFFAFSYFDILISQYYGDFFEFRTVYCTTPTVNDRIFFFTMNTNIFIIFSVIPLELSLSNHILKTDNQ